MLAENTRRTSVDRLENCHLNETLYVFNVTRQSFLSLGVVAADTPFARLRGLLGRLRLRSDEGLWVVPSYGIHTFGLLFPIDVVYLDAHNRVLCVVEHLGPLRFAPLRRQAKSVLELPTQSIFGSGTQVGDQLFIGTPEEVCALWAPQGSPHNAEAGAT
jgi:uncharacterized membrane protein (UPF0127 family)